MEQPRKKRAVFTAPNSSTKAILKRNSSSSPLLQLPAEIRNQIWKQVLGDSLIHLFWNDSDVAKREQWTLPYTPWRHIVCNHDCPENHFKQPKRFEEYFQQAGKGWWRLTHDECDIMYEDPGPSHPITYKDHEGMHLAILRACRQIYAEGNIVLHSTNTFSFACARAWRKWIGSRSLSQKRLIRGLRFEMTWWKYNQPYDWDSSWNTVFPGLVLKDLTSLKSLRLTILNDWTPSKYKFLRVHGHLRETQEMECLARLSALPLTSAEVFFRVSYDEGKGMVWKRGQRKECAAFIKGMLLDPKGGEIFEEEQKWLKEQKTTRLKVGKKLVELEAVWKGKHGIKD